MDALITTDYVANELEIDLTGSQRIRCVQLIDEVSQDIFDQTGEDFTSVNLYPDGVPATIKGIAARAVIRGLNTDSSSMKSLQVGDVVETYGGLLDYPPGDAKKLAKYGGNEESWQLEADLGCDRQEWNGTTGVDL